MAYKPPPVTEASVKKALKQEIKKAEKFEKDAWDQKAITRGLSKGNRTWNKFTAHLLGDYRRMTLILAKHYLARLESGGLRPTHKTFVKDWDKASELAWVKPWGRSRRPNKNKFDHIDGLRMEGAFYSINEITSLGWDQWKKEK
jgi:hypothetical protein